MHLAFFCAKRWTYLSEADHLGSIPNPTTFTPGILDNRPPTISIPISKQSFLLIFSSDFFFRIQDLRIVEKEECIKYWRM